MKDSSSPFYLHYGDHPGLILVSHHLFGSNYNTQSRTMMMVLMMKNKVEFINGYISWPASDDILFNAMNRYNNMGQILMMEPLPPLTKVFALVIQEERQWNINYGSSSFRNLLVLGHTIDKCYKLHGYPPGYKSRSKNSIGQAQTHQTISVISNDTSSTLSDATLGVLSSYQCQQFIALLSSQLHQAMTATPKLQELGVPSVSNFLGLYVREDDWDG
ncbi:hypothetical protein CK203_046612 [Vitis vinifera]|uniref:Retrotransposon Copia-like N-terminal domain-containing protein n=1 Tax=Vitis vinifera TaxID=29760 RepID=A0A438HL63_VITVI|nr:hypothetical protein CK203_046612 [Vitis vinifera]